MLIFSGQPYRLEDQAVVLQGENDPVRLREPALKDLAAQPQPILRRLDWPYPEVFG